MPPRYPIQDPDGFLSPDPSLPQDPVFRSLMAITRTGPIGALRRWIDRRIEAHEDRLYEARLEDVIHTSGSADRSDSVALDNLRVQSDRDIAA